MGSLINRFKRRFSQGGDTLVEVLISLVVLGLVLTGAYALSTHSLGNGVDAQNRNKALSIAQSQIEYLVNAQKGGVDSLKNFLDQNGLNFHENGQAFCVNSSNVPKSASDATCQDGNFATQVQFDSHTNTYTINTKWSKAGATSKNQVTLYYKEPQLYSVTIDQCDNIDGIQLTVPPGYSQVGKICTPNGGGGGGGGGVIVAGGGGPPICVIYSTNSDNSANGTCLYAQDPNIENQEQIVQIGPNCWETIITACNDDGCASATHFSPGCTGTETPVPPNYIGTSGCPGQVGEPNSCNPYVPGSNICDTTTQSGSTNPDAPPELQCQNLDTQLQNSFNNPTSNPPGGCVPSAINDYCFDPGNGGSGGGGTTCTNGATNPPNCDNNGSGSTSGPPPCDSSHWWNGSTCVQNGQCGLCGCSLDNRHSLMPSFGAFHLFIPTKYFACWPPP